MRHRIRAISWDDHKRAAKIAAAGAVLAVATGLGTPHGVTVSGPAVSVIVHAAPGQLDAVQQSVDRLGGHVTGQVAIINSVVASVPSGSLARLSTSGGVLQVSENIPVQLLGSTYDPSTDLGSMYSTAQFTGARAAWNAGYSGKGVDVALIDSGVAPVQGLGNVVNGPDLSLESQAPSLLYNDSFGHGTFMAGIIAGNDQPQSTPAQYAGQPGLFYGMAPDSRIVSLKVADAQGNTDISQILAAIDWVVQHRNDPTMGLNIRVMNLSFGTTATQGPALDPLAYAVEQAWFAGIVVVVAGGNNGNTTTTLLDPAYDPYVMAVAAADPGGYTDPTKFLAATFSNSGGTYFGSPARNPDLMAPGAHIVSLRDPGSYIDTTYGSTGLVGTRFFRGSGTSQATAVMSGAVADVLQANPTWTPDMVKYAFTHSTYATKSQASLDGAGEVNIAAALAQVPDPVKSVQSFSKSTGAGPLDGSRGGLYLSDNSVQLTGNKDIFGQALDSTALAQAEAAQTAWNGGSFMGYGYYAGNGWTTDAFLRSSWSSGNWQGTKDWAGSTWQRSSWSSVTWSSAGWSRSSWSNSAWDGDNWTRSSWSCQNWETKKWS